eukprot:Anaeramoba_ignava/a347683_55.p1 GENE.a347683_55~~a347683_55.p1  ORF type:complete len:2217 (+),score=613.13 a347683_55:83-6733(+)
MENYQFIKTIGKGSFGKVKLAIHKLTNIQVAIKIISKALMSTKKNSQKRLQMELQILQKIRHPNIISLFEILENDHFVYLVLEYASGGELFDYIVAHTKLDEDLSRRFFRQIIDGIDYCHRLNVVHRDIKPENILIDDQNNIKIIDFGLSNFFHPNDLLQTFCGSPLYSAPEVISQKKYDGRKSDIWSAGVVLYTLLCGKLPFPGTNHKEVCEKILNGKFTIPQHVSLLAKDLLVKMIEFDTQKRITIDQIRAHQWFNLGYNGPPIRRPISTDLIQNIDTDIIRELQMLNVPSDKVIHSLDSAVFDSFTASYLLIQFKKMQLNSQKINLVDNDKSLKFENSLAQIPQEIITKKDPSKNTSKNFKNFAINKEVHKISSPIQNQFQFNKSPNKNQDENSQLLINMSEEEKTKRKKNEFKMKYLPNKMNEDQQIQTNLNNSKNSNNLNNSNNSNNLEKTENTNTEQTEPTEISDQKIEDNFIPDITIFDLLIILRSYDESLFRIPTVNQIPKNRRAEVVRSSSFKNSSDQIISLAKKLFPMIETLINNSQSIEEATVNFESLLSTCFLFNKQLFTEETLKLIKKFVTKNTKTFFRPLLSVGLFHPFIQLIQQFRETSIIYSCLLLIHHLDSFISENEEFIQEVKKEGYKFDNLENIYHYIHKILIEKANFHSDHILEILFEIFIGKFTPTDNSPILIIKNPFVLKTICHLANQKPTATVTQILRNLLILVSESKLNKEKIISQFAWQKWMVELIDYDVQEKEDQVFTKKDENKNKKTSFAYEFIEDENEILDDKKKSVKHGKSSLNIENQTDYLSLDPFADLEEVSEDDEEIERKKQREENQEKINQIVYNILKSLFMYCFQSLDQKFPELFEQMLSFISLIHVTTKKLIAKIIRRIISDIVVEVIQSINQEKQSQTTSGKIKRTNFITNLFYLINVLNAFLFNISEKGFALSNPQRTISNQMITTKVSPQFSRIRRNATLSPYTRNQGSKRNSKKYHRNTTNSQTFPETALESWKPKFYILETNFVQNIMTLLDEAGFFRKKGIGSKDKIQTRTIYKIIMLLILFTIKKADCELTEFLLEYLKNMVNNPLNYKIPHVVNSQELVTISFAFLFYYLQEMEDEITHKTETDSEFEQKSKLQPKQSGIFEISIAKPLDEPKTPRMSQKNIESISIDPQFDQSNSDEYQTKRKIIAKYLQILMQENYNFLVGLFTNENRDRSLLPIDSRNSFLYLNQDIEKFIEVLSSSQWKTASRNVFSSVVNQIRFEIYQNGLEFSETQTNNVFHLRDKLNNDFKIQQAQIKSISLHVEEKIVKMIKREKKRIFNSEVEKGKKDRIYFQEFERMVENSISEKDLWSLNTTNLSEQNNQQESRTYLKLEQREDALRRRKKLKVCFRGSKKAQQQEEDNKKKENLSNLNRTFRMKSHRNFSFIDQPNLRSGFSRFLSYETHENEREQTSANIIMKTTCMIVTISTKTIGTFEITMSSIDFFVDYNKNEEENLIEEIHDKDYSWNIQEIESIHKRRYLFEHTALEIFLAKRKCVFMNFANLEERNQVFNMIQNHKLANLKDQKYDYSGDDPSKWIQKTQFTKMWQRRQISNFEYLMHLNTLAGRTYQDFSQYPIFPWVIADYESEVLDLSKQETFRDLSKPIGALNNRKKKCFVEHYGSGKRKIHEFNHESHYSTPDIVLGYLIRLEPFTSILLKNYDGYLDRQYQIFSSIPRTWKSLLENKSNKTNISNVSELIPEFFYLPEFLYNPNNFNFTRSGESWRKLSNVELPKWAKNAEEFIRFHREALESEYVSKHLHEWIDLIFGSKQRGSSAKNAFNLFFPGAYEENNEFDKMDEQQKQIARMQIDLRGQIPMQLFTSQHSKRLSQRKINRVFFDWKDISQTKSLRSYKLEVSTTPIIFSGFFHMSNNVAFTGSSDKIITMDKERIIGNHRWVLVESKTSTAPFSIELDTALKTKTSAGVSFAPDIRSFSGCAAIDCNARFIICCGFWDDTFKIFSIENSKMTQSISRHKNVVTCLALDGEYLVTGSRDTTVIVWKYDEKEGKVYEKPKHVFLVHDREVNSVDLKTRFDIVVSASKDGSFIIHTLHKGKHIRTVFPFEKHPVSIIKISNEGDILTFSDSDMKLRLFTINGYLLKEASCAQVIYSLEITPDSQCVVFGGREGIIQIRSLVDLKLIHSFELNQIIYSIVIASGRFMIVGFGEGNLLIGYFVPNQK